MTSVPHDPLRVALAELARVPRLLVALDFDGTLAPHVDVPSDARALPEAAAALAALRLLPETPVALVSGRSLESLIEVSDASDGMLLVGSHGVEANFGGAESGEAEGLVSEADRVALGRLRAALDAVVASEPGSWIEAKPAGFAVHTRALAAADAERTQRTALAAATSAGIAQLTVRDGKDLVEFSVRAATKGDGIRRLRAHTAADAVLFAGDDVTDEDGFAALQPHDVGIKVGEGATAAAFRAAGPEQLSAALAELATARAVALTRRD